jgi:hypothetical protein
VLIALGRHEHAAASAEVGAKEFQLSIQGISISSASSQVQADALADTPPLPPASHARLRHALSWIRGKQLEQQPAEATVDALPASDGLQLLYNTGELLQWWW